MIGIQLGNTAVKLIECLVPLTQPESAMLDFADCEAEYRKAAEKYRSAGDQNPDPAAKERRWRIVLAVEFILLACFLVVLMFRRQSEFCSALAALFGIELVITLPLAFLYLIGRPPVVTVNWFSDSAECRAMTWDVGHRTALTDDEFYARFYEGSGIPVATVTRTRCVLRKNIDPITDRLVPTDYLPLLWEGLDFADLFYVLVREFGVTLGGEGTFNGTLDSLILLVDERIQNEAKTVGRIVAEK